MSSWPDSRKRNPGYPGRSIAGQPILVFFSTLLADAGSEGSRWIRKRR